MAERERELLDQGLDAYNRRDPGSLVARWSPDCEWHPFLSARVEGEPGYTGTMAFGIWFEDVDAMFAEMHAELGEVREVGDRCWCSAWSPDGPRQRRRGEQLGRLADGAAGREASPRLGLHEPRGGRARRRGRSR